MMKWILLMFAIFPDNSTMWMKGKLPFATEISCRAKADEVANLLTTRDPRIRVFVSCTEQEPLPGEAA